MKKRILPFIFFALTVGFSFLLISSSYAGNTVGKGKESSGIKSKSSPAIPLDLSWQELGPINAAGRTRSLIYDNRDASGQTLYTGGVAGGVWKSTNLGLTWQQVNTSDNQVLKVSCMAQTASGVIYVGTGEMSCFSGDYMGSGLYRSEDGITFSLVPGTAPLAGQFTSDWAFIMKLAVAPSGRIYAATSSGLKYSDDGNTWMTAINGTALDVVTGKDNTVLAAVDHSVFIQRSGETEFTNLSTGLANTLPIAGVSTTALAISPSDENVMYVSTVAQATGALNNLYMSSDKGLNWNVIFPGNDFLKPLGTRGCYANTLAVFPNDPYKLLFGGTNLWYGVKVTETGFYDWQQVSAGNGNVMSTDPTFLPNYHHVYVFSNNDPNQFAIATDNGVSVATIKSTGFEFRHAIKGLAISQFESVAISFSSNAAIGGVNSVGLEYLPGNMLTYDPKTGVQITTTNDVGQTVTLPTSNVKWSTIKPTDVFYGTNDFTVGGNPANRSEDLGYTTSPTFNDSVDNSTGRMPLEMWENMNFSDTRDSIWIKAKKNIPADTVIIVKSPMGGNFPMHYLVTAPIAAGDSIQIPDPIANRFFIAGGAGGNVGYGIWMTKEALVFSKNPRWFNIAPILTSDSVTAIKASKDLHSVWAATSKGKLIRATNVNNAYDFMTADIRSGSSVVVSTIFDSIPEFMGKNIASLAVSEDNQNVLVFLDAYGLSNNVYLITNALSDNPTVTSVQGNMPPMPVYSGLFEMTNQNRVIIGTDYGVFATSDIHAANVEWTAETNGLGNVPVTQIVQQTVEGVYYYRPENYGNLYISTLGRGVYMDSTYATVLGVTELPATSESILLNVYPNPFSSNVTISYKLEKNSIVDVMVYDLSGRLVSEVSLGNQIKGDRKDNINLSNLSEGSYIIKVVTSSGSASARALKVK